MGAFISTTELDENDFDAINYVNEDTSLDEVINIRQAFINCGVEITNEQIKVIRFRMIREFPFLSNDDLKNFVEKNHPNSNS